MQSEINRLLAITTSLRLNLQASAGRYRAILLSIEFLRYVAQALTKFDNNISTSPITSFFKRCIDTMFEQLSEPEKKLTMIDGTNNSESEHIG